MLTISLVTYNHTFESIAKLIFDINTSNLVYKFFIVDNSPTNILQGYIEGEDKIEYIFPGKNIGFGAAHNLALKKALEMGLNYHIVVNPDILFEKNTLELIIKYLDEEKEVGLLMPKILYPNGSIQFLPKLLPSPWDLLIRRIDFTRIFNQRIEKYEMRQYCSDKIFEAPVISGCFSCFRTEALMKIGLFDERFFMYFEDFDLSRRINEYYKTVYYPKIEVFHEYERGAQKSFQLFIIFVKSAIKYFNKWGWFFDKERKKINKKTLAQFN